MLKQLTRRAYLKLRTLFGGSGISRLSIVRYVDASILSLVRTNRVKILGNILYLDSNDALGLSTTGTWEITETKLVLDLVKEGDIVLDIGAHIGYFTLLLAKLVGKRGRVIAFEPDPDNFKLLKKNVAVNGYSNVVLENKAVSDTVQTRKLYRSGHSSAASRLHNPDNWAPVQVSTITLDSYLTGRDRCIDFIKMDAEGAEASVVRGADEVLRKSPHVKIVTEFSPNTIKSYGDDPSEYLYMLVSCGFSFYDINEDKEYVPIGIQAILRKYPSGSITNLLCVK